MSDVSSVLNEHSGPRRVPLPPMALEIAAGSVGGAAQLGVGHPFDTTKVKLQRDRAGSTAMGIVRNIIRSEGFVGLYAGITAPLPFVVAMTAALFSANAGIRNLLLARPGRQGKDELSLTEVAIAGAGAGGAVSIVLNPTELVKCRMQAEPMRWRHALHCAQDVYKEAGMRAFGVGFGATLVREIPGTAAYFGTYEAFIRWARRRRGAEHNTVGEQMMGGGLAGVVFWSGVYPVDYAKTAVQVDSLTKPNYTGWWDCCRRTAARDGIGALFRGMGPALARSFPACAVTFVAYEKCKKLLS